MRSVGGEREFDQSSEQMQGEFEFMHGCVRGAASALNATADH